MTNASRFCSPQAAQASSTATINAPSGQAGFATWVAAFLLLVIFGMVLGGYLFWVKTTQDMNLMHDYIAQVETNLKSKNETVVAFNTQLAKLSADTQSQDLVLTDHLRALEDELNRVGNSVKRVEQSSSSESWLLAEVEFLVKSAGQRILMKEDVAGAVKLLESAEDLIKKLPVEDKGLMNVRVAISQDIASLEVYREVDVPGTYAKISSLGSAIEKLPLVPDTFTDSSADDAEEPKKKGKKAKPTVLASINDSLAGYMVIRRHDTEELKMLLSPEQRINLRDSIRLTTEQAQTALLRGDQRTYDQSLANIRKWLHNYFVADNFRVKMAIKKLDGLTKIQVERDLPDISSSQQELKRYISDRMRKQG